ncbi:MAG: hypothetical protein JXB88_03315 [Spirochaetales bacterium]|nr:hypothetical protein [Spirochaetales bacterium]
MTERKRVKVKYINSGFETEYYEDVAEKLKKKGKIMILKQETVKSDRKKPAEKKDKPEDGDEK